MVVSERRHHVFSVSFANRRFVKEFALSAVE